MNYNIEYIVLQLKYRKIHMNKSSIFPEEWYNIKEYELKIDILKDCINNNCLIIESNKYPKFKELALK